MWEVDLHSFVENDVTFTSWNEIEFTGFYQDATHMLTWGDLFCFLFFMSEGYNGAFLPCDSPLVTDPSSQNCLNQLNWHVTSTSRDAAEEHHKYATLCSSSASYTDPPQPLTDTELHSLILYKCADSIHQ